MFQEAAPALFGVEGLRVADVQAEPGGAVEVWTITDWPAAAACPGCGTVSSRLRETVVTRPRDVRRDGLARFYGKPVASGGAPVV